jgi:hypothetical protein
MLAAGKANFIGSNRKIIGVETLVVASQLEFRRLYRRLVFLMTKVRDPKGSRSCSTTRFLK